MNYLYIPAIILIVIGIGYEIAYYKRKRVIFDGKCNDFFIISRALEIAGTALLFINAAIMLFRL